MPHLVYYRDANGVVSGPLQSNEANSLLKAGFFRPEHLFKVVSTKENLFFHTIDDLRSLNGADTPFENLRPMEDEGREQKELIRVYKELATVLQERRDRQQEMNQLATRAGKFERAKMRLIDLFVLVMKSGLKTRDSEDDDDEQRQFVVTRLLDAGHFVALFENNSPIAVRVVFGRQYDPKKSTVVEPGCKESLPGTGGRGVHIAPCISDDAEDGAEEVVSYAEGFTRNWDTVLF